MKLSRLFALLFLPVALVGCSEPAPECWSPSVKSLLKDIAKESYNKEIVYIAKQWNYAFSIIETAFGFNREHNFKYAENKTKKTQRKKHFCIVLCFHWEMSFMI